MCDPEMVVFESCILLSALRFSYFVAVQVTKPVIFPCFGIFKRERHVLLPSVVDVVVEQGEWERYCIFSEASNGSCYSNALTCCSCMCDVHYFGAVLRVV